MPPVAALPSPFLAGFQGIRCHPTTGGNIDRWLRVRPQGSSLASVSKRPTRRGDSSSHSSTFVSLMAGPLVLELGLLEACGLVPRSRLCGIWVVFLGDHIRHQVLAVDGQTLERLALIAGGQRVGGDTLVHDAGKALLKIGAVHRVVQTPPGLGSVEQ